MSSRYFVLNWGIKAAEAVGYRGIGTVLCEKAESTLLYWFLVSICLCAVRLQGSVAIRKDSGVNHSLFVISAQSPTDYSTDMHQDEFVTNKSLLFGGRKVLTRYLYQVIWIHELEDWVHRKRVSLGDGPCLLKWLIIRFLLITWYRFLTKTSSESLGPWMDGKSISK